MVAYRVNKNLDLQFNVLNLTDETIYGRLPCWRVRQRCTGALGRA